MAKTSSEFKTAGRDLTWSEIPYSYKREAIRSEARAWLRKMDEAEIREAAAAALLHTCQDYSKNGVPPELWFTGEFINILKNLSLRGQQRLIEEDVANHSLKDCRKLVEDAFRRYLKTEMDKKAA